MKLYIDDMIEGIKETLSLYKQGENIFEMGGGNLFPTITSQKMWQYVKKPGHIHFHDGEKTYSFRTDNELNDTDAEMEKIPDIPLPDLFKDATGQGKAQVHRADPGSIYFTLQEGTKNPTYTFRHVGDTKWRAIPKKKKIKAQLAQPAAIPNVNVEAVKEGMVKMLEEMQKQSELGGALGFFNNAAGKATSGLLNGAVNTTLAPGRIGGDPGPSGPNQNPNSLLNAGMAAALGGGLGLGYHALKRNYLNTPEENEQETSVDALRRIALPAAALGGINFAQRSMIPNYYHYTSNGFTPRIFG